MKILNFILAMGMLLLLSACDGIKLTVESGLGTGTYASNAKVKIQAYLPNPGYEFDKWEGDTQFIEDISSKETYMQLPELGKDEVMELNVKATYAVDPSAKEYNIDVENGTGSGSYLTYSVVMITANAPEAGYQFDKWVGNVEYLNSPYLSTQKVIIDKEDISFRATYKVKVIPTVNPDPTPTPKPTVTPVPTTTPDQGYVNLKECNQVEGFVWKMNASGNTAVVNNKAYKTCPIKVNGKSPNVTGGVFDDGRPYWRFGGHPTQFKSPAYVETYCNGKVVVTVRIPDTGKRCSYYPGGWGD